MAECGRTVHESLLGAACVGLSVVHQPPAAALSRADPVTEMSDPITVIASMAPRTVLTELARSYQQRAGRDVRLQCVGGVDAKKRVQSGEVFDVVVLASEAIDELTRSAHLVASSKIDVADCSVAVAVRTGAARPEIGSEQALESAVLAAGTIGYSTGPSGAALAKLFEVWGIAEQLKGRIVTPPPGVPVGELVASGNVALGFQQLSELLPIEGIEILGLLPRAIQITTTFSAAIAEASGNPQPAREFAAFLGSSATASVKRRHGMQPPHLQPRIAKTIHGQA